MANFTKQERQFVLSLVRNEMQRYVLDEAGLGKLVTELGNSVISKLSGVQDGQTEQGSASSKKVLGEDKQNT